MRLFYKALIFLLICISFSHPLVLNRIIATVGDYPITSYDIERMRDFLKLMSGNNPSQKIEPLKELLFFYSLQQIVSQNKKIILPRDEINKIIENTTNVKDASDELAKQRLKIYEQYPDEFEMQIRKSQIVRALMFYDTRLKDKAGEKVSEEEIKKFYQENKKLMVDQPKLDLVIVVCKSPKNASLENLEKFENALLQISDRLKKSNEIEDLLAKNKNLLGYENYSGRTGLKYVFELYQSGIPEELLAFSLSTNAIPTPKGNLYVKPGFVIGPEVTKFRNSDEKYYFVLKVVDRKLNEFVPLEKVKPLIENQLREQKIYNALKEYILEKIEKNELQISLYDINYQGEYDEFLRR